MIQLIDVLPDRARLVNKNAMQKNMLFRNRKQALLKRKRIQAWFPVNGFLAEIYLFIKRTNARNDGLTLLKK